MVAPPRVCVKKEAVVSGVEVVLSDDDDVEEGEDQGNAETKAVAPGVHGTRKSKCTKSKVVVVVAAVMESRLYL